MDPNSGSNNQPKGLIDQFIVAEEEEKTELDKVFKQIFDPANLSHLTELTRNEITAYSVLQTLADKYGLSVLREFIQESLTKRISRGRKGRTETVKIVNSRLSQSQENQNELKGGRLSKWFGRR